jgi:hypothetical protein
LVYAATHESGLTNGEAALVRKVIVAALFFGLCFAGCQSITRQSVAVPLGSSEYDLIFTVAWGAGMGQQFALQRRGAPLSTVSSQWIEIFDNPYNSGATLYVSDDGKKYYLGAGYILLIIAPDEGKLETTCFSETLPRRTPLAELLLVSDWVTKEQLDPGALQVNTYVQAEDIDAALSDAPVPSRYYEGVRYIGRFGVVDDGRRGRGSGVGFAPALLAPEPRLGLEFSCG